MDDKTKLDLDDLDARAHDLDEKAADDVTGGWRLRGNPFAKGRPKNPEPRPSAGTPKKGGNKGVTGGLKRVSSKGSGKDDPFGSMLKAHKKFHSKVLGAFKKAR